MPNALLGQNFLKNPDAIRDIVALIEPRAGDHIFEVGPGHGELTLPLAEACQSADATLVAIEKDAVLSKKLAEKIATLKINSVEIGTGDALEFFNSKFSGRGPFKVVGNLPYYLTGHLLRILSELPSPPIRCVFMVQKEVAERMTAEPPAMNRLAASVQFWAEPRVAFTVPRGSFSPVPKVDSAVVVLKKKTSPALVAADRYFSAMRSIFVQPRKTILNNLGLSLAMTLKKDEISSKLALIGIDPGSRPQNLSMVDISKIAELFFRAR